MKKEIYGFLTALCIIASVAVVVILIGKKEVSSSSVVHIRNGEVVNYDTENNADTSEVLYEAGSNGKLITAYLCLKLVEENKLSLDAPIKDYLSEKWITDDARMVDITVRDLLSHQAGFSPSFEFGVDKKIYFEPGSHFCYSGVGYIYLQQVIEAVTGQSFEQAAKEYVFEPLEMKKSTFATVPTVTPYVSSISFATYSLVIWFILGIAIFLLGFIITAFTKFKLYSVKALFYGCVMLSYLATIGLQFFLLPRMVVPFLILGVIGALILFFTKDCIFFRYATFLASVIVFISICFNVQFSLPMGPYGYSKEPNAAYSFLTDTRDMTLFSQQLLKEYEKQAEPMKEMFTPQITIDSQNAWGAGCAIETGEDACTYWHSGINPGMQSLIVLNPDREEAVIILTNSDYGLEFAKQKARDMLGINGTWDIVRTDLKTINN